MAWSFTHLGPGLVLSASIVGSGELIATTTAGAQVGFALLWLVLLSCAVKVAVQIELARWTIATGSPALSGYNRVPPRFGRIGWVNLLFFLLVVSKVLQVGGIVGGTAIAFSVLFPIGGDPLLDPSRTIWHVIVVVVTIASLYSSRYSLIEKGAVWMVATFSLVTVLIAVGLPFTPWGYTPGDLLSGLTFQPAAGGPRRGDRDVRDHRGRGRRDHDVQLLVHREGVCPVGRAERRQRRVGAPRARLDRRDVQGRAALDGHLHVRDRRLLRDGCLGAAPAGSGAAR